MSEKHKCVECKTECDCIFYPQFADWECQLCSHCRDLEDEAEANDPVFMQGLRDALRSPIVRVLVDPREVNH